MPHRSRQRQIAATTAGRQFGFFLQSFVSTQLFALFLLLLFLLLHLSCLVLFGFLALISLPSVQMPRVKSLAGFLFLSPFSLTLPSGRVFGTG